MHPQEERRTRCPNSRGEWACATGQARRKPRKSSGAHSRPPDGSGAPPEPAGKQESREGQFSDTEKAKEGRGCHFLTYSHPATSTRGCFPVLPALSSPGALLAVPLSLLPPGPSLPLQAPPQTPPLGISGDKDGLPPWDVQGAAGPCPGRSGRLLTGAFTLARVTLTLPRACAGVASTSRHPLTQHQLHSQPDSTLRSHSTPLTAPKSQGPDK